MTGCKPELNQIGNGECEPNPTNKCKGSTIPWEAVGSEIAARFHAAMYEEIYFKIETYVRNVEIKLCLVNFKQMS